MTTLEKILALVTALRAKNWWTAARLAFELLGELTQIIPATDSASSGFRAGPTALDAEPVEKLAERLSDAVRDADPVGIAGLDTYAKEWLLRVIAAIARKLLDLF